MIKTEILEELGDTPVRSRYEMTIPPRLREVLKLTVGDRLGFDLYENGKICAYKIIKHKLRNTKTCAIDGDNDGGGNETRNNKRD